MRRIPFLNLSFLLCWIVIYAEAQNATSALSGGDDQITGSCSNRCGSPGGNGICSCDMFCKTDCCHDFRQQCPYQYNRAHLCNIGDNLPDNKTECESCQGRCGATFTNPYQCLCSTDCRKYNSCCEDFQMTCPEQYQQFVPELCNPRDDVPDNETTCKSCQGRCADISSNRHQCKCHTGCRRRNECCDDFQTLCPDEYKQSCQDRCGDGWNGWCDCNTDCRIWNTCCGDFNMTCPDEYQQFKSCQGRCGEGWNGLCSCHSDCRGNNGCCDDFQVTCPDEHKQYDSCHNRCGDRGGYRQCDCDSNCRGWNQCCEDFQMVCPEEHQQFESCQGRCGIRGGNRQCDCDSDCRGWNTCCEDFQVTCSEEHQQFESCQDRCGERRGFPDQCDCHTGCRRRNECCKDFQVTCPDEYQLFIPIQCDPGDDVPDNETECESCHGRCGEEGNWHQCPCNSECRSSNRCCKDFQTTCPDEYKTFIPKLCDPWDDVPDNETLCKSCQGRCGNMGANHHQCDCHSDCRRRNECCNGFQTLCPNEYRQFTPELCDPHDDNPDYETLCKSCKDRCGQWGNSSYQCACHGECIHFYHSCCTDFQTQCRNEYQEYQNLEDTVCGPDVQIPEDMVQCGTCEKRCGSKSVVAQKEYECNCDIHCHYYGDCCQDFQTSCPEENEQFQQLFEDYPFNRTFQDFQCMPFLHRENLTIPDKYFHAFIISTCPDGTECEFTAELSEDGNNSAPVYDVNRGVHYISGYCAMCNGAMEVTPWEVKLNCDVAPEPNNNFGLVNSTDSPSDIRNSQACAVTYKASGDLRPCDFSYQLKSRIITSTCTASCHNQYLMSLCKSDFVSLTFDQHHTTVYKNGYCAMCNNEKTWYCLKDVIEYPEVPKPEGSAGMAHFSLTQLTGKKGHVNMTDGWEDYHQVYVFHQHHAQLD